MYPGDRAAMCLRGILHDGQRRANEGAQAAHVHHVPEQVDGHDGARPRGHNLRDLVAIEEEGVRAHIDEHRRRPGVDDR